MLAVRLVETSVEVSVFCSLASSMPGTEGAGRVMEPIDGHVAVLVSPLDRCLLGVRTRADALEEIAGAPSTPFAPSAAFCAAT